MSREALEELQSRLYCLQAALEDIERDLERSREPQDISDALDWLRENAAPVAALWIEPRTAGSESIPTSTLDSTPNSSS